MTNLLILYPQIQADATNYKTYTDDTAEDPNEYEFDLFRNSLKGERYQLWRSGYVASEHNAVYDLGNDGTDDITASCNFVVLSRLDYMAASATTIDFALQSSSDDSSYTDRHTITDLSSATLTGVWGNDYVSVFADTSAFRYWRAHFPKTSGSDYQLVIGKIYFGSYFDMGRDPRWQISRLKEGDVSYTTSGGIEYTGRIQHPMYEIKLMWEGVTDAVLASFQSEIVAKRYNTPVFLYTQSFHDPLDGKQLIHCKLTEIETENKYTDWNVVTCTFLEVLG